MKNMSVNMVRPGEVSGADADDWRALQAGDVSYASPHLGPDYARLISTIDENARVVLARNAAGRLVAVLPITIRSGRFARAIGVPFCDYSGPILAQDIDADLPALVSAAGLSALRFNATPDPFGHLTPFIGASDGAFVMRANGRDGAQILEDQRAKHPKAHKNFRRQSNKLEKEGRQTRLVMQEPVAAEMEQLFTWKNAQYRANGKLDVLNVPLGRKILDHLLAGNDPICRPFMISFYFNDRFVAGEFGFRVASQFQPWIAAYDPDENVTGPGNQLMREALLRLPENGLDHYDLGTGHGAYKKFFCNTFFDVHSGIIIGAGLAGLRQRVSDSLIRLPAIGPLTAPATKLRRRLDHIAACETRFVGRAALFADALIHRKEAPPAAPANANDDD